MQLRVREARDRDAEGLIALIGACFAEYPGCVLDVDGELPELRRIASAFCEWGGAFRVVEEGDEIVGSIGWVPSGGGIELRKLYVARRARRRGLGAELCAWVEGEARRRQVRRVFLWSDTRFEDAHRLYERLGYRRGATRELFDQSSTVEFFFARELSPRAEPTPSGTLR